jgi:chemotaxis signal transduction protein
MNALIPSPKKQLPLPTETLVTIAFPDINLLIPIADVAKIIPLPEVRASSHGILGLANIENEQAIVLDLHYPLYGSNQPNLFAAVHPDRYLVLLQGSKGLQYGLVAPELPLIQKIACDQFQPIATANLPHPEMLGNVASRGIAQPAGFVIDVTQMIPAVRQWASQA